MNLSSKKMIALMLALLPMAAQAQRVISIDNSAAGIPVQDTMYGLFFEDINYGADGGLYAELVKNRSFEFDQPLMGWKTFGKVSVREDGPFDRCPHYVRISNADHPVRWSGLENEGFFGMGIEEGKEYRFSVWARTAPFGHAKGRKAAKPAAKEVISVHLCSPGTWGEQQNFASGYIEVVSGEWKKYEIVLKAPKTDPKAVLRVFLESWGEDDTYRTDCCVDLEHISLFPVDVFNGDENGMRKDIAQTLADLTPGVLRFPGGCVVEGTDLENRYQWKNSVGPVENRPININRWNYATYDRMFPDYYQSYGLGFYEFFRFAEELGAEPLPVISCGMACQFQNDPEDHPHADIKDLQPYIDDALDLIEFANGPADSRWGKVRAEMGHPKPFGLKFLAVGNEQWGPEFVERLELFIKQIRAKYPEIQLIGSSGPYLAGEWFDELWPEMRRLGCDLVDEHYYSSERFFENNADRYDSYPREGTKVFAGEYACHGSDGKKFNHFNAALVEAAFMTGLERNADVVYMATYAPLLAHVEGWQWRPDMVWFDNTRVMRTSNYYVQQMYSNNKGREVIPVTMDGRPVAGKEGQSQLYATAVRTSADEIVLKVVNLSPYAQTVQYEFIDAKPVTGGVTVLHNDNPVAENTLDEPDAVVPVESVLDMASSLSERDGKQVVTTRLGGRSFAVYRFGLK